MLIHLSKLRARLWCFDIDLGHFASQIGPLTTKHIGIALGIIVWWLKLTVCQGGFHMHQAHFGKNDREGGPLGLSIKLSLQVSTTL